MCFYEQYVYACRDWKWGNFRQHCQAEYRTGETCGMKMVYQALGLPEKCKHIDDYNRWRREPKRYQASIEKALGDIKVLEGEINGLKSEKHDRYRAIGNSRR
jgi:hypothetical protein